MTKIYLLPGTMCNEKLWQRLIAQFDTNVEFVHVIFPMNKSCDQIAEYLNKLFDEDKVNLIGFSLGGYIAANFACKYPQRIAKLLLISNTPCSLTSVELNQRKNQLAMINKFGYKGMSNKVATQLLDSFDIQTLEQSNNYKSNIEILMEMDKDLGEAVLKNQLQHTSARKDLLPELVKLPIKLNFIFSAEDPLINRQWLSDFQATKECYVEIIKGRGHMLPLEQVEALRKGISSWLNNESE